MANVIVWGKTRDVLAGELPLGLTAEEVDTLANLQAHLGRASVIITDREHLERERAALELWVRGGGTRRALLLDRKSTRLNSSHLGISYAVFCLKKKKKTNPQTDKDSTKTKQGRHQ